MLDFEVKSKVQPVGERKGQTVYYAQVKSQQKLTNKILIGKRNNGKAIECRQFCKRVCKI